MAQKKPWGVWLVAILSGAASLYGFAFFFVVGPAHGPGLELGLIAGFVCAAAVWRASKNVSAAEVGLAEAVLIWTGFSEKPTPDRDDARLIRRIGADAAAKFLPQIKQLQKDFYKSNANFMAADVSQMATMASDDFRKLHPGASDQIVEAFAWCYTYDFK